MSVVPNGPMFRIPGWVKDLESFRRWMESEEFPEQGRLSHLDGDLWVDMSLETVAHNLVKARMTFGLDTFVVSQQLGHVFSHGMRLTHPEAKLSTEPKVLFASNEAFQRQRIKIPKGDASLELIGSPEMVLEIVSDSSEVKDTQVLPDLYWKAGVREYWLVDPRNKELHFDIYRRGKQGFTLTKKKDGWLRSQVFGKEVLLSRQETGHPLPEYTLEMR